MEFSRLRFAIIFSRSPVHFCSSGTHGLGYLHLAPRRGKLLHFSCLLWTQQEGLTLPDSAARAVLQDSTPSNSDPGASSTKKQLQQLQVFRCIKCSAHAPKIKTNRVQYGLVGRPSVAHLDCQNVQVLGMLVAQQCASLHLQQTTQLWLNPRHTRLKTCAGCGHTSPLGGCLGLGRSPASEHGLKHPLAPLTWPPQCRRRRRPHHDEFDPSEQSATDPKGIAHLAVHCIPHAAAAQKLRLAAPDGQEVRLLPEVREVGLEVLPELRHLFECQAALVIESSAVGRETNVIGDGSAASAGSK